VEEVVASVEISVILSEMVKEIGLAVDQDPSDITAEEILALVVRQAEEGATRMALPLGTIRSQAQRRGHSDNSSQKADAILKFHGL